MLAGLAGTPKTLPPKYFYDEQGCALFEAICALPEYPITRAEMALMDRHVGDMARFLGQDCHLVEFGSGSGRKSRQLLDALRPAVYTPIDIAEGELRTSAAALLQAFPDLRVDALCADYTRPFDLPRHADAGRIAVYFPGSTIGNFDQAQAADFLRALRELVGAGGAVVIGVDTKKEKSLLEAAYDDAQGVTAAFNLNLLARINRELGADFDLASYAHMAIYNEVQGRIEMHLRALAPQRVAVGGRTFSFAAGETILSEISCKYAVAEFQAMATVCSFRCDALWQDKDRLFAVYGLTAV